MDFFKNWIQPNSYTKIGFEDVKYALKYPEKYVLINTLSLDYQNDLIKNTLLAEKEEITINKIIEDYEMTIMNIIIYGRNATDETPYKKAKQFTSLGFKHVFIYCGGLFEWLLLQEIYGFEEFPTLIYRKNVDILKYKQETKYFEIY
jgi:hypothetical protein